MLKEYSQKKHRTMKGTLEKWIEEKYETIKSSYGVKLRADGKRE